MLELSDDPNTTIEWEVQTEIISHTCKKVITTTITNSESFEFLETILEELSEK